MKALFTLNDPPYGTERVYNGLRLADALLKKEPQTEVTIFLMADSVIAAKAGQKTPDGYYSVERMLKCVLAANGKVARRRDHYFDRPKPSAQIPIAIAAPQPEQQCV